MLITNTHITLCARSFSKYVTQINLFSLHSVYEIDIYYSHCIDKGIEAQRLNITQLASDRAGI